MNNHRKRVSGRLEDTLRGLTIVTDGGDRWVLHECDLDNDLLGWLVTVEGVIMGFDRLQVVWIGASTS
jgi:hypothetical protein